jgi:nucleotide-binding universal stress UspA family protein
MVLITCHGTTSRACHRSRPFQDERHSVSVGSFASIERDRPNDDPSECGPRSVVAEGSTMNIVLGIDGSESSAIAADLVTAASWPDGTRIRLVAAIEAPADWSGLVPEIALLESSDEGIRAELCEVLDEQAARLRARGLITECVVQRGRAASVLLKAAEEPLADLIVVGSRGHGAASAALLGSVSATLADHAPCPVLVARRRSVRRIVLATDGSESAEAMPQILGTWGVFRGVAVDVVSVAPDPARTSISMNPWLGTAHVPRERPDDAYEHQRAIAEQTACRLAALGLPSSVSIPVGNAAREIERVAREMDADLVITGSRGRGQLQRLLLGSVAHRVLLHVRCSVLIMRGHVPARAKDSEAVGALAM